MASPFIVTKALKQGATVHAGTEAPTAQGSVRAALTLSGFECRSDRVAHAPAPRGLGVNLSY